MSVDSTEQIFVEQPNDLYSAENQIATALPKIKMVKTATSDELCDAFHHHLEQTKDQIKRLEQIFSGRRRNGGEGLANK